MNKFFATLAFLMATLHEQAQVAAVNPKQKARAEKVVMAYNQQNYSALKRNFIPIIRILPIKRAFREVLEPMYLRSGKWQITELTLVSPSHMLVTVQYERHPWRTEHLSLSFSKKARLSGFYIKPPEFTYKKDSTKLTNQSRPNPRKVKACIDTLVNHYFENGVNGSVMAIDNGQVIYSKNNGYAFKEKGLLLNDSSMFELASCSKQFTGMAIMMLIEQKKVAMDDKVEKYIPGFPYKNITVRHLIGHTSGLPDYESLMERYWDKTKYATNEDIVELFKTRKAKCYFEPGEKFMYSNTGYAMLSLIIEKVSGQTYAEFLKQNIFTPLGMTHTRVYNTRRSKSEPVDNYAYGYVFSRDKNREIMPDSLKDYDYVRYLDAITGDGTVSSCIKDLYLWEKGLWDGKLISDSSAKTLFTGITLNSGKNTNYAFGQMIVRKPGYEPVAHHSGGWPGYRTIMVHFLDTKRSVIVLSNNESSEVLSLADQVLKKMQ